MNEAASLLKKAFEGAGYCAGDWEDASANTLWLEKHGLQGLPAARRTLQRDRHVPEPLEILSTSKHQTVIDAHHRSLITAATALVELAVCRALSVGEHQLEVRNCHERDCVIAALANRPASSTAIIATWRSANQAYLATLIDDMEYPRLQRFDNEAPPNDCDTTLTLIGLHERQRASKVIESILATAETIEEVAPVPELQRAASDVEKHGLKVDLDTWEALVVHADTVLVESTDRSRLGAGEQPK